MAVFRVVAIVGAFLSSIEKYKRAMLLRLCIRDVLFVPELDVSFDSRFNVLTGETGAGKSILLESLGLVLGRRADSALVRAGCSHLSVTATFDISALSFVQDAMFVHGLILEEGDPLILRRSVSYNGRSRAFVNDVPVSIGMLRTLGDMLVEIHGQWDTRGLSETSTHQKLLDSWAGIDVLPCHFAWERWQKDINAYRDFLKNMQVTQTEEEALRRMEHDLAMLAPQPSEETDLLEQRRLLAGAEKIREGLNQALRALSSDGDGLDTDIRTASRALERLGSYVGPRFSSVISTLDRVALDVAEIRAALAREHDTAVADPQALDQLDDRLFALRTLARKHGCFVDQLPDILEQLRDQLRSLEDGSHQLSELERRQSESRMQYLQEARRVSEKRRHAASQLDAVVAAELPAVKLDQARFIAAVDDLPESQWGVSGIDRVVFMAATNPGADPDVLGKSVSGGELSRFMLVLRVVLARASCVPTVIFDEIDAGMGGATSAAVGDHLARLSEDVQVLAVTHSPQVASQSHAHWRVMKNAESGRVVTSVIRLDQEARREEIARMLAGEVITDSARAAADSLLDYAG